MNLFVEGSKPDWWNEKVGLSFQKIATPTWSQSSNEVYPASVLKLGEYPSTLSLHRRHGVYIGRDWTVLWEVHHTDHYYPGADHVQGLTHFNHQEYVAAFGLADTIPDEGGVRLVDRYHATSAALGKFIRQGDFLNIPGPGTGEDVDANLSIFLTPEIKAVAKAVLNDYLTKNLGQEIPDPVAVIEGPLCLR